MADRSRSDQAFMEKTGGNENTGPWLCHLSYIKPHWPYIVPAPYHDMYAGDQVIAPIRDALERDNAHPVYQAFMETQVAEAFQRDEVRDKVIPAYMGLIKQCDDQIGRLLDHMERSGRMDDTMIVITSDHGDYLGDHWLGEKDFFHDASVKVPMIVYDPSPEADKTRGSVCDELVESIDLAATFLEVRGADIPDHIVEGRSLLPFLRGEEPSDWRDFAVSEYDYSMTPQARKLGVSPRDARLFMLADKQWKFIHAEGGFRPMLFNLVDDPDEYRDLGGDPAYGEIIAMMYDRLGRWARRMSQRTTISDAQIAARHDAPRSVGVLIGVYDDSEASREAQSRYHASVRQSFVPPTDRG